MLIRLAVLFLFILAVAALASWLAAQPGHAQVEWLGWRFEMPTSLAVALVIIFALGMVFFDRLYRLIKSLPSWLDRSVQKRRDLAGHKALTLGLMAVSAGEPAEAKRQAARARRLLDAPQLTNLLAAQASALAGDHQAARRYFTSLIAEDDSAFLGHIGMMRLALDDDAPDAALASARKALALRPKSTLAAAHIVQLEAARHDWQAALPALDVLASQRRSRQFGSDAGSDARSGAGSDKSGDNIQSQRTALLYMDACEHAQNADRKGAQKLLIRIIKDAPGFVPAVLMLSDIYLETGANRKAVKVLEKAFGVTPHALIANRLKLAWQVNDGRFIAKLMALIPADETIADAARCIIANQALDVGLDGEAAGQITAIPESRRDADAWQAAAHIAQANGHQDDANAALVAASKAPRPQGWQCDACKSLHDDWQSHCPDCDSFAQLVWQRPDRVTPLFDEPV